MGREQRWNFELYGAVERLLDEGGELSSFLKEQELPALAELLRRQLGGLVLGLADGGPTEVDALVGCVQRTLDLAFRRVGVRRELIGAYRALEEVEGLLTVRERGDGPVVVREPPPDQTTVAWVPE